MRVTRNELGQSIWMIGATTVYGISLLTTKNPAIADGGASKLLQQYLRGATTSTTLISTLIGKQSLNCDCIKLNVKEFSIAVHL